MSLTAAASLSLGVTSPRAASQPPAACSSYGSYVKRRGKTPEPWARPPCRRDGGRLSGTGRCRLGHAGPPGEKRAGLPAWSKTGKPAINTDGSADYRVASLTDAGSASNGNSSIKLADIELY